MLGPPGAQPIPESSVKDPCAQIPDAGVSESSIGLVENETGEGGRKEGEIKEKSLKDSLSDEYEQMAAKNAAKKLASKFRGKGKDKQEMTNDY
ncbi:hypothetical protein HYALB_00012336 [Hymenoscyphus albidus]|uniref:Uncharacterized protein n=1 Tax=Hymenoscyphus albidus TaxID=595503 RepID=A0A9N9Q5G1_9HELO|nr:hypothetical protein HYALB_00012336 [Hymenoscyphus albidus]